MMKESMPARPEGAPSPTRILIVDDHELVRRGMSDLLAREIDLEICGEAADETEALRLIAEAKPDLAVVDITLKAGNGIDLIKRARELHPQMRVVVSSMHDESLFGERCFRAGAMGYVNKEDASEKVVAAIRTVMDGRLFMSQELADRILQRALTGSWPATDSPVESLTDRELEVFGLIGNGFTTRQIAEKLHLSHKTIEGYRENIKAKLKLKNATELNRHAVQFALEEK